MILLGKCGIFFFFGVGLCLPGVGSIIPLERTLWQGTNSKIWKAILLSLMGCTWR